MHTSHLLACDIVHSAADAGEGSCAKQVEKLVSFPNLLARLLCKARAAVFFALLTGKLLQLSMFLHNRQKFYLPFLIVDKEDTLAVLAL